MPLFSSNVRSPIAIDIQPSLINVVQLTRRTRGEWSSSVRVSLRRTKQVESQTAEADADILSAGDLDALTAALKRLGATGDAVALRAPAAATCVQLLELPPRGADTPIEALARAEIARLARWDDGSAFRLQTWDVPPPPARAATSSSDARLPTSLGAAALLESAVSGYIDQLSERGWSTVCVVPAPVAAATFAAQMSEDRNREAAIVLDVNWDRSALTIVRDGVTLYHRDLPDNGLSLLARGLVAELHLSATDAATAIELGSVGFDDPSSRAHALCESFGEALAGEIEATIAFAARRYGDVAPRRLLLVGQGTRIRGFATALRTRLEIPASTSPDAPDDASAMAGAVARWAADRANGAGLLPERQRATIHRERLACRWLTGAVAAAAIGLAMAGSLYALTSGPNEQPAARLAAIARDQTRLDADSAAASRRLSDLRALAVFHEQLANQVDYSALLRVVGSTIAPSTTLSELAVVEPVASPRGTTVTRPAVRRIRMAGSTSDTDALGAQVASLRAMELFDRVELARTARSPDGSGVVFELSLDLVAPTHPTERRLP